MKYIINLILAFCMLGNICSCRSNIEQKENFKQVGQMAKGLFSKEVYFPKELKCYIYTEDTTLIAEQTLLNKPYKIMFYADSTGCTGCRLELPMWQARIEEADSLFADNVGFLFFLQPKNMHDLNLLFFNEDFHYPVFIDKEAKIDSLNHFPKDERYRCFLLDKDNKVVGIGNPTYNTKVWELYKQIIADGLQKDD